MGNSSSDCDLSLLSQGVTQLSLRPVNRIHSRNGKSKTKDRSATKAAPQKDEVPAPLASIRNENYHLKLELMQKSQELEASFAETHTKSRKSS